MIPISIWSAAFIAVENHSGKKSTTPRLPEYDSPFQYGKRQERGDLAKMGTPHLYLYASSTWFNGFAPAKVVHVNQ